MLPAALHLVALVASVYTAYRVIRRIAQLVSDAYRDSFDRGRIVTVRVARMSPHKYTRPAHYSMWIPL